MSEVNLGSYCLLSNRELEEEESASDLLAGLSISDTGGEIDGFRKSPEEELRNEPKSDLYMLLKDELRSSKPGSRSEKAILGWAWPMLSATVENWMCRESVRTSGECG